MIEVDKTTTWGNNYVHKIVFRSENVEEVESWLKDHNLIQVDKARWKDDYGNYYRIIEV
jgi:hypothetical protein